MHLTPGHALFSVHLLPARHQFIWPSPFIYNHLLNKTHWYPSGFCHLLWLKHSRGYITGGIRRGLTTIGLLKTVSRSFGGVILISLKRNTDHPHLHALVPSGIMKVVSVFYEQRSILTPVIAEIFRGRLLTVFHIPSPYESLVYYYGLYSSSHRGKERRENRDDQSIEIQETKGTGKASSAWARLIHRIFEINPLLCIKCGGHMRIIAFITDYQTSKMILKHIGEETIRPPPLIAKIPTANIPDTVFWDSIPSVEVYFQDIEYGN